MITALTNTDIPQVVKIHIGELHGFLTDLGEGFLHKFYEVSLSIPEMFTLVEKENEQIKGFATAVTRVRGLYKRILLKDPFPFVMLFLGNFVTHPGNIVRIVRSLTYPGFADDIPELLTIAVPKNHQGKGIGGKLFAQVSMDLKKRGCKNFRVSIYDKMPANKFYERMGGRREKQFEFLGSRMNYYSYKIRGDMRDLGNMGER